MRGNGWGGAETSRLCSAMCNGAQKVLFAFKSLLNNCFVIADSVLPAFGAVLTGFC